MKDLVEKNLNLISIVITVCYIWFLLWVISLIIEQAF